MGIKYRVYIPQPKAKRMVGRGRLTIVTGSGWEPAPSQVFALDPSAETFEFEVPDHVPYRYATSIIDGTTFDVAIHYDNKDGSRTEVVRPVPERIK